MWAQYTTSSIPPCPNQCVGTRRENMRPSTGQAQGSFPQSVLACSWIICFILSSSLLDSNSSIKYPEFRVVLPMIRPHSSLLGFYSMRIKLQSCGGSSRPPCLTSSLRCHGIGRECAGQAGVASHILQGQSSGESHV